MSFSLDGQVAVVTGAAGGIGSALCRRFAADGAHVVATDLPGRAAELDELVESLPVVGCAVPADVATDEGNQAVAAAATARFGPIDLWCANAGVAIGSDVWASDDEWALSWAVNVMGPVRGMRAVLGSMVDRGIGRVLVTASAAGLLTNLGAAPYTATKHAAVGLAEWLAITYASKGIAVHCLCPMGVDTDMLRGGDGVAGDVVRAAGRVLAPAEVADAVVDTFAEGRFWVLPHPEVASMVQRKVGDIDGWLGAMSRVQAKLDAALGGG